MSGKFSPFWNTWYHWKALRLPWRKQFMAGRDLEGNTYWEFNDVRHSQSAAMANARPGDGIRMRRIVKYPRGTHPGSVQVSPQWHQWLRHVRDDAPSLLEQQREVARQEQMKVLAARADARWAGAQRVDGPVEPDALGAAAAAATQELGASAPAATTTLPAADQTVAPSSTDAKADAKAQAEPAHAHATQKQQTQQTLRWPQQQVAPADDPWKREQLAHGALGESWQPAPWSPPAKKR
ncbi:hypothetical protein SPBR_07771 [Sporothrix brasiliensis 5110]|uniref:Uncharacterized protein n=1 Tax=Sporothrix brasiliensis 5110 TaxID=1398154 RepID=A0A0C2IGF8_9PEZI|nr:uncharacterized protein SPBR_07771 [Sporothrix brasiliensis 5110]KIH88276.1 hypothetical protein SPBR_07771 [Sporothrix brasiliensis 5110]